MSRRTLYALLAVLPTVALIGWVGLSSLGTERDIADHTETVRRIAAQAAVVPLEPTRLQALPPPVRRYLAFALPDDSATGIRMPDFRLVEVSAVGDFRRPQTEGFAPTTASQTIAINTPALMFAATTPIFAGIWARAYDFFAEGRMSMRAKIASTLTVVDERETEALNRTSLRRWLLESPLYPAALLPGGPVRWEAVDSNRARAIVSGFGLEASLVATFRADGGLVSFQAEEDGDLSTPYHGSGEFAARDDYRLVQGMMIPHAFEISRSAGGRIYPFWKGQITTIAFR